MMKESASNSYLFGNNAPYIEEQYEAYLNNPSSVSDTWRSYFDALQNFPASNGSFTTDIAHGPIQASLAQRARSNSFTVFQNTPKLKTADSQVKVQSLIDAHRFLGVRLANIDPLKRQELPSIPELKYEHYGLSEADMDQPCSADGLYFPEKEKGKGPWTVREIVDKLRETYCGTIGAEFMHISEPAQKDWWKKRLEESCSKPTLSIDKKKNILKSLTAAEGLEHFLQAKYVGQKRFSLEGGESFIVAMEELIRHTTLCKAMHKHVFQNETTEDEKNNKNENASIGVPEIVIGMAHRGRLNVLVNTLRKMPADLFAEFEGKNVDLLPAGDVKYHKGFSSDISTDDGPVHLALAFNPSHLEIVNPVVEGSAKARMARRMGDDKKYVIPVQVHGDAAFAGQGVVMETLNLAQTRGYSTYGTIHIVINNQIGFTTSDPRDARSTLYCTDVVKMIEAPVLHVNGDDPEAVVFAMQLALEFRMEFSKDVVVDIVCYRKLGHNEQDTPSITQPLMYKKIAAHPGARKIYAEKLLTQQVIDENEAANYAKAYQAAMKEGKHTVDFVLSNFKNKYAVDWSRYLNKKWTDAADTAVPLIELQRLIESITTIPEKFKLHPIVEKVIANRRQMGAGNVPLDWGMAEHLAFASLVASGSAVRLTGQDSGRGTFSHRHAVLHDQNREKWDAGYYIPLKNVAPQQAKFTVIDSVLSEEAVLGFEYGYSTAEPDTLVIWEAQFGDFVNGAQVVIDQFIASGEVKWGRASGLTMLLPHGYEGQGPEHSSARIERFLQLCADTNMQVVQPTTPSQIFHLLRRQMIRQFRKPLIVFTPKSLLRHKEAISSLNDLATGKFHPILKEHSKEIDAKKVKRVLVCSGRVYYDLLLKRNESNAKDISIIRIEQLYPFAHKDFQSEMKKYVNAKEVVWVQDEPQNQGPWFYIQHHLLKGMNENQSLKYCGRAASASPAVGYAAKHAEQQKELINEAFGF